MSKPESFHNCNDGRGVRRVYVNGNEIQLVVWCDTRQGIVVFLPHPFKVNRRSGTVVTRRLKGVVTVEQVN
ncbi:hypothetical protein CFBP6411_03358 [Pseudomonas syringae group genomosp. 3]|uniref:Uncharacterized protein n=1 Tax=Pseudomonas syringae group genomosp. 3 TaxID=251701 RepID=A0A2K4WFP8_9PSED|nr:hypothetical protein [Pseudomonas syringae group genomosp. 3]SOS34715.1 hypothetical protein CFBP6411_03358 [Pseudomonas syringae group genomosp. 3]